MALETKVVLAAAADVVLTSTSRKQAYIRLQKMANVEGVTVKGWDDAQAELDGIEADED
ncbi:MAG: hypothetical protein FWD35_01955 [Oscillospiraceae bacterium]|nr:hypothetical protein [Oscillospiraceae bacterium]